jgi:hypothetical protein
MRNLDAVCAGLLAVARAARPFLVMAASDKSDISAAEALKLLDAFIAASERALARSDPGPKA